MIRAVPRLAPILMLLMLVPACSGPSAPSPATSANAPAATAAPATTAAEPGTPASVAAAGGFEFLGSDPAPGKETSVTESAGIGLVLRDLAVRLTVHFNQSLPEAIVQVELLDENGRQCASGFVDQPVAPGHVYPVSNSGWIWREDNCVTFPVSTVTLKASLVTLRAARTEYVVQTFPVRYTVRRYPPPPQNPPEAPPKISNLSWNTIDPTAGSPIPGDVVLFECTGSEADGAPVTVRITQRWDGLAPVVHTKAFPAGASSSPSGARFPWGAEAPNTAPVPRATIECVVTNDRGQHAVQTINIPR